MEPRETVDISDFKKISLIKRTSMSVEELEEYYLKRRKYNFVNGEPLRGIGVRKVIHPALLGAVKLDRVINKSKIQIVSDKSHKTKKPVIYAATHIGGKDIERTFEAIKKSAYLLLGDPKGSYKTAEGLITYLNGGISLEAKVKEDRHISKMRAIELLNKGGNLLIYPEGAWNTTVNLPVMKLYTGAVDMALETGAEIVPIALEDVNDTYYINIGENISYSYEDRKKTNKELTNELRDTLATLRWGIWEKHCRCKYEDLQANFKEKYAEAIVDKCSKFGYTLQDVLDTRFNDKNEISEEEVFKCLDNVELTKENAFVLTRTRNKKTK